jgi:hypothetical protein
MYKNYVCPTCGATQAFPSADAPLLQPACTTARCFGRLVFESETPYPPAPGPAPVMTAEQIAKATSTLVTDRDGTFCSYRIEQDRSTWKIKFKGKNKGTDKNYELELIPGEPGKAYQLPKHNPDPDADPAPSSDIFVLNAMQNLDWEPGPSQLPKVLGPPPARKVLSYGHDEVLLTSPIRVQLGSQKVDDAHSGSGLIHIMFSHDRDSLQGVQSLIHGLLFPTSKIKAVYKTKQPVFGYYRYIILGEGNTPFQLILEGREGYLRLITVYKGTENIKNYNKFKKVSEYSCLYAADRDIY